jgi:16S rRNA (guanine966-N2)-methyltransferase
MSQRRKTANTSGRSAQDDRDTEVRIIGGKFGGRRLHYHGDPVVRPMKQRTREAIFNLISTGCNGRHAIDLFAGTGALGLEALSRGALSATFIEKHVPTARIVEENIQTLAVGDVATIAVTSAFLWAKRDLPNAAASAVDPWLVFCSPPYAFYVERGTEMLDLIQRVRASAPLDSILVVEAEEPFDFSAIREADSELQQPGNWDIRTYRPAVVGIWHKMDSAKE